jgi:four helix bundle protein
MFDYQKLHAYQKARTLNKEVRELMIHTRLDDALKDQLRRAMLSVLLNIVEGAGRYTHADKKNFYVIARASVFEVSVIFEVLLDEERIDLATYEVFDQQLEAMSKMLFKMIKIYTK